MLSSKALIAKRMEPAIPVLTLYDTLRGWLGPAPWRDARHLQTLAWMLVGLLSSGHVALAKWTPFCVSRAEIAQSTQRRFERWLHNRRIPVLHLYGALLKHALADFRDKRVYLALDTTMLWDTYCVVYVALAYRGRMIPLAWKVMEHGSASVAFKDYRSLLVFLARQMGGFEACLLADRGFMHRELMRWVKRTPGWHFRIRCKAGIGLYCWKGGKFKSLQWQVDPGRLACHHGVYATGGREAAHLVVGWQRGAKEPWVILSDEPTWPETLHEYGLRFHIEEGFLGQKSNGFQWESSKLRDRHALQRLCFVMAAATLALVCQGVAVAAEGKRRAVDPHWFRGHSYARIGWDWIRHALARGKPLLDRLRLPTAADPERARASKRQPDRSNWADGLPCKYHLLLPAQVAAIGKG
jgi:hypothetical protein